MPRKVEGREVKWKVGNEIGNGESRGGGRQAPRKVFSRITASVMSCSPAHA